MIAAQLLFLEAEDPDKEISLVINSPGGSALRRNGDLRHDAVCVRLEIRTVCVGMAMSAAWMILCGGAAGKRFALPNSKMMIHQGSGGFHGTPADIQIAAREILEMMDRMARIIARHSGQSVNQVKKDIDRAWFMTPDEAVAYGLVDGVMHQPTPLGVTRPRACPRRTRRAARSARPRATAREGSRSTPPPIANRISTTIRISISGDTLLLSLTE